MNKKKSKAKPLVDPLEKDGHRYFKNRAHALRYLKANGYKVGRDKLYQDFKKGLCHMQPDGTVYETALFRYVNSEASGLVQRDKIENMDAEVEERERTKRDWEVKLLKIKVKNEEFKLEKELGKWIAREDVELEIISRAMALKAMLKNWISYRVDHWARLRKPDQLKADLVQGLEDQFNEYANVKAFHVIFEEN